MITPNLLCALVIMDAALIIYAFLDNENRNSTHIFSGLMSIVVSWLIAYLFMFNLVGILAIVSDDTTWVPFADPAVGYLFVFIGVVMMIYTILSGLEAATDTQRQSSVELMDE